MTTERVAQMAQMWNDGMSGAAIARELGITPSTVYRHLAVAGISPLREGRAYRQPGTNRRYSNEQESEIVRRYQAGESMTPLAHAFGCNVQTISNIVRRHGVATRAQGGRKKHFTAVQVAEMARRYQAGESQTAIAQSLGVHQIRVNRALREHGVKPKRKIAAGSRHGMWKGGRLETTSGYIQVMVQPDDPLASMRSASGYVMEHRLVMARHLGRPLEPWETVHHIDGDKTNNAIDNLQLRVGRHGTGIVLCCADCGSTNIVERTLD